MWSILYFPSSNHVLVSFLIKMKYTSLFFPPVTLRSQALRAQSLLLFVLYALLWLCVRRNQGVVGVFLHLCGLFPGPFGCDRGSHLPGWGENAAERWFWSHGEQNHGLFSSSRSADAPIRCIHVPQPINNPSLAVILSFKQLQLWSGGLGHSFKAFKADKVRPSLHNFFWFTINPRLPLVQD